MINRLTVNAADLAADYKARGMGKYRAWDQFVIDRALRPEIDARSFYGVYESVSADPLREKQTATVQAKPVVPRVPDPEFADYGRTVEIWNVPGSRICGLRDGETLSGTVQRTLNDGSLYEVRIVPGGDESRATTFRYRAENVRFLD
jgi:hypothetical protein